MGLFGQSYHKDSTQKSHGLSLCMLFSVVGYCVYCFQMLDTVSTVFRCWILCMLFSDVGYCVYCF